MTRYDRVACRETGRTGIVTRRSGGLPHVVWDDAAQFPGLVGWRWLLLTGAGTATPDDVVCYAPGQPQHALSRGAAIAQGRLSPVPVAGR